MCGLQWLSGYCIYAYTQDTSRLLRLVEMWGRRTYVGSISLLSRTWWLLHKYITSALRTTRGYLNKFLYIMGTVPVDITTYRQWCKSAILVCCFSRCLHLAWYLIGEETGERRVTTTSQAILWHGKFEPPIPHLITPWCPRGPKGFRWRARDIVRETDWY